jgi:hypothetical protein
MPTFTSNTFDEPAVTATNTANGDGIKAISDSGVAVRATVNKPGAIGIDVHGEQGTIAIFATSTGGQVALFNGGGPSSPSPCLEINNIGGTGLQVSADSAGRFFGKVEVTGTSDQPAFHATNTGTGAAIFADGTTGGGLAATSVSDVGVHSANHSASETAIFGINDTPGQQVPPNSKAGAGSGVWGHTRAEKGAGLVGSVEPGLREAAGVVGLGPTAGRFFGDVEVTGQIRHGGNITTSGLEVRGTVTVDGDILMTNRDVAEQFGAVAKYVPGSVMVIGENALLELCRDEYDKRAVGIISGAGPLRPAITLGHLQNETPTASIAMIGTTFCLVDAQKVPIEVGDLLTSSSTPGHAMKATDHVRSFGAVVGKALGSLPHGRGLIPVVVALQ